MTSWKAVKEAVVGVGAVVAVAVSDPVDSVVDIAAPAKRAKKASGAVAAVVSVAALGAARVVVDSVARSGVGDRRVELEVGAVDVADVTMTKGDRQGDGQDVDAVPMTSAA